MKLLAFTFAMIVVPIGSYFVTVNNVFNGGFPFYLSRAQVDIGKRRNHFVWSALLLTSSPPLLPPFFWSFVSWTGNSTYAGALAAIMANVVLITYVVVAMNEDQSEQLAKEAKKKS